MYTYNIYSSDQKSGPQKRTPASLWVARSPLWVCFSKICIRFGFALGLLRVPSESARGLLWVCSTGFSLCTQVWSGPRFVVTVRKPHPCIFQIHFPTLVRKVSFSEAIGSIHIFRIWPYIRHRIVTLSVTVWINSKIQLQHILYACIFKRIFLGKKIVTFNSNFLHYKNTGNFCVTVISTQC